MTEIISAELETHAALKQEKNATLWRRFLGLFARMRFQLGFGMVFAVALPILIRLLIENFDDPGPNYEASVIATTLSFLIGFVVFRKLTSFPGIRTTLYILPAFACSFALIMTLFMVLRIDYSRGQFLLSFMISIAWFHAVFLAGRSTTKLKLAILPFGNIALISQLADVEWVELSRPVSDPNLPLVADLRADMPEEWERFIADEALKGRAVYHVKQVFESLSGRTHVEHLSETRFGTLAPNTIYAPAKYYFDWLLAIVMLIVLAPLMLVVAIAIRLDSEGPAIFRQQRMGFRGQPFTIFKFRSMRVQTASEVGAATAEMTQSDDDRITRMGRFIRKSRLDELPQIFNILTGEMSWIGPRPEAMGLSTWYEREIPFYAYRHLVRPGITGWAQVKQGHITSLDDAKLKLEYDFFYVRNLSFWLDMLVVIKTIGVIFSGRGAK